MTPGDIIVWTGVAVFVITALLTVLDMAGIHQFKSAAQRQKLFAVLILSIVTASVAVFKDYFSEQDKETVEASPIPDINACIIEKSKQAEFKSRTEKVELGVAAGLGKLIRCKTQIVRKEKAAIGPRGEEYVVGQPIVSLLQRKLRIEQKYSNAV